MAAHLLYLLYNTLGRRPDDIGGDQSDVTHPPLDRTDVTHVHDEGDVTHDPDEGAGAVGGKHDFQANRDGINEDYFGGYLEEGSTDSAYDSACVSLRREDPEDQYFVQGNLSLQEHVYKSRLKQTGEGAGSVQGHSLVCHDNNLSLDVNGKVENWIKSKICDNDSESETETVHEDTEVECVDTEVEVEESETNPDPKLTHADRDFSQQLHVDIPDEIGDLDCGSASSDDLDDLAPGPLSSSDLRYLDPGQPSPDDFGELDPGQPTSEDLSVLDLDPEKIYPVINEPVSRSPLQATLGDDDILEYYRVLYQRGLHQEDASPSGSDKGYQAKRNLQSLGDLFIDVNEPEEVKLSPLGERSPTQTANVSKDNMCKDKSNICIADEILHSKNSHKSKTKCESSSGSDAYHSAISDTPTQSEVITSQRAGGTYVIELPASLTDQNASPLSDQTCHTSSAEQAITSDFSHQSCQNNSATDSETEIVPSSSESLTESSSDAGEHDLLCDEQKRVSFCATIDIINPDSCAETTEGSDEDLSQDSDQSQESSDTDQLQFESDQSGDSSQSESAVESDQSIDSADSGKIESRDITHNVVASAAPERSQHEKVDIFSTNDRCQILASSNSTEYSITKDQSEHSCENDQSVDQSLNTNLREKTNEKLEHTKSCYDQNNSSENVKCTQGNNAIVDQSNDRQIKLSTVETQSEKSSESICKLQQDIPLAKANEQASLDTSSEQKPHKSETSDSDRHEVTCQGNKTHPHAPCSIDSDVQQPSSQVDGTQVADQSEGNLHGNLASHKDSQSLQKEEDQHDQSKDLTGRLGNSDQLESSLQSPCADGSKEVSYKDATQNDPSSIDNADIANKYISEQTSNEEQQLCDLSERGQDVPNIDTDTGEDKNNLPDSSISSEKQDGTIVIKDPPCQNAEQQVQETGDALSSASEKQKCQLHETEIALNVSNVSKEKDNLPTVKNETVHYGDEQNTFIDPKPKGSSAIKSQFTENRIEGNKDSSVGQQDKKDEDDIKPEADPLVSEEKCCEVRKSDSKDQQNIESIVLPDNKKDNVKEPELVSPYPPLETASTDRDNTEVERGKLFDAETANEKGKMATQQKENVVTESSTEENKKIAKRAGESILSPKTNIEVEQPELKTISGAFDVKLKSSRNQTLFKKIKDRTEMTSPPQSKLMNTSKFGLKPIEDRTSKSPFPSKLQLKPTTKQNFNSKSTDETETLPKLKPTKQRFGFRPPEEHKKTDTSPPTAVAGKLKGMLQAFEQKVTSKQPSISPKPGKDLLKPVEKLQKKFSPKSDESIQQKQIGGNKKDDVISPNSKSHQQTDRSKQDLFSPIPKKDILKPPGEQQEKKATSLKDVNKDHIITSPDKQSYAMSQTESQRNNANATEKSTGNKPNNAEDNVRSKKSPERPKSFSRSLLMSPQKKEERALAEILAERRRKLDIATGEASELANHSDEKTKVSSPRSTIDMPDQKILTGPNSPNDVVSVKYKSALSPTLVSVSAEQKRVVTSCERTVVSGLISPGATSRSVVRVSVREETPISRPMSPVGNIVNPHDAGFDMIGRNSMDGSNIPKPAACSYSKLVTPKAFSSPSNKQGTVQGDDYVTCKSQHNHFLEDDPTRKEPPPTLPKPRVGSNAERKTRGQQEDDSSTDSDISGIMQQDSDLGGSDIELQSGSSGDNIEDVYAQAMLALARKSPHLTECSSDVSDEVIDAPSGKTCEEGCDNDEDVKHSLPCRSMESTFCCSDNNDDIEEPQEQEDNLCRSRHSTLCADSDDSMATLTGSHLHNSSSDESSPPLPADTFDTNYLDWEGSSVDPPMDSSDEQDEMIPREVMDQYSQYRPNNGFDLASYSAIRLEGTSQCTEALSIDCGVMNVVMEDNLLVVMTEDDQEPTVVAKVNNAIESEGEVHELSDTNHLLNTAGNLDIIETDPVDVHYTSEALNLLNAPDADCKLELATNCSSENVQLKYDSTRNQHCIDDPNAACHEVLQGEEEMLEHEYDIRDCQVVSKQNIDSVCRSIAQLEPKCNEMDNDGSMVNDCTTFMNEMAAIDVSNNPEELINASEKKSTSFINDMPACEATDDSEVMVSNNHKEDEEQSTFTDLSSATLKTNDDSENKQTVVEKVIESCKDENDQPNTPIKPGSTDTDNTEEEGEEKQLEEQDEVLEIQEKPSYKLKSRNWYFYEFDQKNDIYDHFTRKRFEETPKEKSSSKEAKLSYGVCSQPINFKQFSLDSTVPDYSRYLQRGQSLNPYSLTTEDEFERKPMREQRSFSVCKDPIEFSLNDAVHDYSKDSTPEPDYDDGNPPASRQQRSFSACLETLRFQMSDGVPDYNKSAVTSRPESPVEYGRSLVWKWQTNRRETLDSSSSSSDDDGDASEHTDNSDNESTVTLNRSDEEECDLLDNREVIDGPGEREHDVLEPVEEIGKCDQNTVDSDNESTGTLVDEEVEDVKYEDDVDTELPVEFKISIIDKHVCNDINKNYDKEPDILVNDDGTLQGSQFEYNIQEATDTNIEHTNEDQHQKDDELDVVSSPIDNNEGNQNENEMISDNMNIARSKVRTGKLTESTQVPKACSLDEYLNTQLDLIGDLSQRKKTSKLDNELSNSTKVCQDDAVTHTNPPKINLIEAQSQNDVFSSADVNDKCPDSWHLDSHNPPESEIPFNEKTQAANTPNMNDNAPQTSEQLTCEQLDSNAVIESSCSTAVPPSSRGDSEHTGKKAECLSGIAGDNSKTLLTSSAGVRDNEQRPEIAGCTSGGSDVIKAQSSASWPEPSRFEEEYCRVEEGPLSPPPAHAGLQTDENLPECCGEGSEPATIAGDKCRISTSAGGEQPTFGIQGFDGKHADMATKKDKFVVSFNSDTSSDEDSSSDADSVIAAPVVSKKAPAKKSSTPVTNGDISPAIKSDDNVGLSRAAGGRHLESSDEEEVKSVSNVKKTAVKKAKSKVNSSENGLEENSKAKKVVKKKDADDDTTVKKKKKKEVEKDDEEPKKDKKKKKKETGVNEEEDDTPKKKEKKKKDEDVSDKPEEADKKKKKKKTEDDKEKTEAPKEKKKKKKGDEDDNIDSEKAKKKEPKKKKKMDEPTVEKVEKVEEKTVMPVSEKIENTPEEESPLVEEKQTVETTNADTVDESKRTADYLDTSKEDSVDKSKVAASVDKSTADDKTVTAVEDVSEDSSHQEELPSVQNEVNEQMAPDNELVSDNKRSKPAVDDGDNVEAKVDDLTISDKKDIDETDKAKSLDDSNTPVINTTENKAANETPDSLSKDTSDRQVDITESAPTELIDISDKTPPPANDTITSDITVPSQPYSSELFESLAGDRSAEKSSEDSQADEQLTASSTADAGLASSSVGGDVLDQADVTKENKVDTTEASSMDTEIKVDVSSNDTVDEKVGQVNGVDTTASLANGLESVSDAPNDSQDVLKQEADTKLFDGTSMLNQEETSKSEFTGSRTMRITTEDEGTSDLTANESKPTKQNTYEVESTYLSKKPRNDTDDLIARILAEARGEPVPERTSRTRIDMGGAAANGDAGFVDDDDDDLALPARGTRLAPRDATSAEGDSLLQRRLTSLEAQRNRHDEEELEEESGASGYRYRTRRRQLQQQEDDRYSWQREDDDWRSAGSGGYGPGALVPYEDDDDVFYNPRRAAYTEEWIPDEEFEPTKDEDTDERVKEKSAEIRGVIDHQESVLKKLKTASDSFDELSSEIKAIKEQFMESSMRRSMILDELEYDMQQEEEERRRREMELVSRNGGRLPPQARVSHRRYKSNFKDFAAEYEKSMAGATRTRYQRELSIDKELETDTISKRGALQNLAITSGNSRVSRFTRQQNMDEDDMDDGEDMGYRNGSYRLSYGLRIPRYTRGYSVSRFEDDEDDSYTRYKKKYGSQRASSVSAFGEEKPKFSKYGAFADDMDYDLRSQRSFGRRRDEDEDEENLDDDQSTISSRRSFKYGQEDQDLDGEEEEEGSYKSPYMSKLYGGSSSYSSNRFSSSSRNDSSSSYSSRRFGSSLSRSHTLGSSDYKFERPSYGDDSSTPSYRSSRFNSASSSLDTSSSRFLQKIRDKKAAGEDISKREKPFKSRFLGRSFESSTSDYSSASARTSYSTSVSTPPSDTLSTGTASPADTQTDSTAADSAVTATV